LPTNVHVVRPMEIERKIEQLEEYGIM